MRKVLLNIFFLLSFLLAYGQESGTIRGKIFNAETGLPLPEVSVTISGLNLVRYSDANGYFEFRNIVPGSYTLKFYAMGYREDSANISLKPHDTLFVKKPLLPISYRLPDVIITATRSEKPAFAVPVKTDIISEDDLTTAPVISADEALNVIPGINSGRNYGIYYKSPEVNLRGLNRNVYTLLLIDGIPQSLIDGSAINWNKIHTDNIERIEIIKGPNGSLYGSNAMGGVINIITRKPDKPLSGSLKAFYGTYNTAGGYGIISGRTGKTAQKYFYGTADGYLRQSDGYIMQPDSLLDHSSVETYLTEYHSGVKAGYVFSEKENLEAEYRYSYDLRGAGKSWYEPGGNYNCYKIHNARLSYSRIKSRSQIVTNLFMNRELFFRQFENIKSTGLYYYYHTHAITHEYGFWSSWTRKIIAGNELTAGADVKSGFTRSADIYHTSTDTVNYGGKMNFFGVFLQDEQRLFNDRLSIIGGLRLDAVYFNGGYFNIKSPSLATEHLVPFVQDYSGDWWLALSPRLGIQWRWIENKKIILSWSRGFRPATLSDLCRTSWVNKGFKIANPHLKPETLDNLEVDALLNVSEKIKVEPSVYYSFGHNFQYFIQTGDSVDTTDFIDVPVIRRENIAEITILGAEIKLHWFITKKLDFIFHYSFTYPQIRKHQTDAGNDLTGLMLNEVPPHLLYGRLSWKNPIVNISLDARYVDKEWIDEFNTQFLPSYYVLNAKIYRSFADKLNLALVIQNIFNKRFTDNRGYLSPGRYITCEMKVIF